MADGDVASLLPACRPRDEVLAREAARRPGWRHLPLILALGLLTVAIDRPAWLLPVTGAAGTWPWAPPQEAKVQGVQVLDDIHARRIAVNNSCPFSVKIMDGMGDQWKILHAHIGETIFYDAGHCQGACRTYFVPSSYKGKPGKYSMGPVEPLGFFEYSLTPDGTLSPDISYIGGIGIPMTMQCKGDPAYGCTDGGYGGWSSFQERLKRFCPGKVEHFPNSPISYCSPGQYGGVQDMPYGKKWDVQGTFQKVGVKMTWDDPHKVAFCQPWHEATQCAQANRGVSGCTGESVCDGESLFYQGYDMRDAHAGGKWRFNAYAAFVHTICGVYSGFAFPADDRGVGIRAESRMKYASNKGSGCRSPVLQLCPAASPSFTVHDGYAYPPAGPQASLARDTSPAPPPPPSPTPSPPASKLTIINHTPVAKGGATIYDATAGHSISVFGASFCHAMHGGCVVHHGHRSSWSVSEDAVLGIQWNLARLAPDGRTCDNLCRQLRLDRQSCRLELVPASEGYCATVPTPTWTPGLEAVREGDACVVKVSGASDVDGGAALCSCSWGAYPCTCPGSKCSTAS